LESKIKKIKNTDSINYDAGILLEGYATFGFPEKIYPTWSSLENKNIPQDKLLFLCEFLQSCSTGEDDYFTQSLIMAVKLENHSILKYPKNYSELIEKFSNQYKIDSTIIYSLIRGESFLIQMLQVLPVQLGCASLWNLQEVILQEN
jgi:soluble lytic murein transglycosylase